MPVGCDRWRRLSSHVASLYKTHVLPSMPTLHDAVGVTAMQHRTLGPCPGSEVCGALNGAALAGARRGTHLRRGARACVVCEVEKYELVPAGRRRVVRAPAFEGGARVLSTALQGVFVSAIKHACPTALATGFGQPPSVVPLCEGHGVWQHAYPASSESGKAVQNQDTLCALCGTWLRLAIRRLGMRMSFLGGWLETPSSAKHAWDAALCLLSGVVCSARWLSCIWDPSWSGQA